MTNILIWVGIFIGGMVFTALFKTTIIYWLWRMTGGVRRLIKESDADSLLEFLGLSSPHLMETEIRFTALMPIPDFNGKSRVDLNLPSEVSFTRDTQGSAENRDGLYPLNVTCHKVFPVNPKRIRHGCCGKYSLLKAVFLRTEVGGDPLCSGGIRSFWPPFFQRIKEYFLLRNILRGQNMQAFVSEFDDGKHYPVYDLGSGPAGDLTLFVGDEGVIASYARKHELKMQPLQVSFV